MVSAVVCPWSLAAGWHDFSMARAITTLHQHRQPSSPQDRTFSARSSSLCRALPCLPARFVSSLASLSPAWPGLPACLPHRSPARRETFPRPPLTIARTHRKGAPSVAHLTPAHQRPALEHPSEPSRALPCLACMHDRSSRATIPHRRRTDGLTDC